MQVELAQLRYRLPRLRGRGNAAQPAGCAASAPAVPVRRSSRSTAGASCSRVAKLERDLEPPGQEPRHAAQGAAAAARCPRSRWSATRTRGSRRCSTASPTPTCSSRTACSPRSTRPPAGCDCPAARRCSSPTPSGSSSACRTSWSSRSGPRSRRSSTPTCSLHVVDAGSPDAEQQIDGRAHGARARSAPTRCPSCSSSTRSTSPTPGDVKALLGAHPDAVVVSAVTGEGVDCALGHGGCPPAGARSYRGAAGAVRAGRRGRRAAP